MLVDRRSTLLDGPSIREELWHMRGLDGCRSLSMDRRMMNSTNTVRELQQANCVTYLYSSLDNPAKILQSSFFIRENAWQI